MELPDELVDALLEDATPSGIRIALAAFRGRRRVVSVPGVGSFTVWISAQSSIARSAGVNRGSVGRNLARMRRIGGIVVRQPGRHWDSPTLVAVPKRLYVSPAEASRLARPHFEQLARSEARRRLYYRTAHPVVPPDPPRPRKALAPRGGDPWERADIEHVLAHLEDRSLQALGGDVGRTRKGVLALLKRLGIEKPAPDAREDEKAAIRARNAPAIARWRDAE